MWIASFELLIHFTCNFPNEKEEEEEDGHKHVHSIVWITDYHSNANRFVFASTPTLLLETKQLNRNMTTTNMKLSGNVNLRRSTFRNLLSIFHGFRWRPFTVCNARLINILAFLWTSRFAH